MTTETTDTNSPSPANTPLALKLTEWLGPAVPQEVMTYLHAYGDSRADDDGMSGVRISEAILALRRWSAAVQAAERERCAQWLRDNYQAHPNIASLCDSMAASRAERLS